MDALATPLFEMDGISKRYGGVHALRDAALSVEGGRIHAILGENGAGKSTLIKIIAGVVAADSGRMMLEGREVTFASPSNTCRPAWIRVRLLSSRARPLVSARGPRRLQTPR